MFVRQSTFNKVQARAWAAEKALDNLLQEWNTLVSRINALGGESFLQTGETRSKPQLTKDDLTKLIQLCHPDKHSELSRVMATEMTMKLLQLKKEL